MHLKLSPARTQHVRTGLTRPAARARAWAGLGKADSAAIYGVPFLVGLSVVPVGTWTERTVLAVTLALLGTIGLFTACVTLDDVRGYRDGSDAANYGSRDDHRGTRRKPLVSGLISPSQARTFAYAAWVAGGLLWCASVATAPVRPVGAVALAIGLIVFTPQYSWGLRLSHRGLGETLMAYFSVALVITLPLLVGGELSLGLVSQALLTAVWHITVSSYANTADAQGDREVRRHTLATVLGPRRNLGYLALLTTTDPAATTAVALCSPLPWWTVLVLAPVLCARMRQAWRFFSGNSGPLTANTAFWRLYCLGGCALAAANMTTPALPPR